MDILTFVQGLIASSKLLCSNRHFFSKVSDIAQVIEQVIRSCANVKIATTTKDFSFSFELLVFVAQYGQLLVLSTCFFSFWHF